MGQSSANAKVRLKNSAECLAPFGSATVDHLAEVWPNMGKNLASFAALHLLHFALAAAINLKSLYLLSVTS